MCKSMTLTFGMLKHPDGINFSVCTLQVNLVKYWEVHSKDIGNISKECEL